MRQSAVAPGLTLVPTRSAVLLGALCRQARGDPRTAKLVDAFARLDDCGADAELIADVAALLKTIEEKK